MLSIKYEDFSNNYDLFVKLCEITSEPVKLVKEGRPDLIVMNAKRSDAGKRHSTSAKSCSVRAVMSP